MRTTANSAPTLAAGKNAPLAAPRGGAVSPLGRPGGTDSAPTLAAGKNAPLAAPRGGAVSPLGRPGGTDATRAALWKHTLLIAASLLMLYPLLWMLASAFKPEHLIFSDLSLWPKEWNWSNFAQGWNGLSASFTQFYFNSFLVAGLSVAGNLVA